MKDGKQVGVSYGRGRYIVIPKVQSQLYVPINGVNCKRDIISALSLVFCEGGVFYWPSLLAES